MSSSQIDPNIQETADISDIIDAGGDSDSEGSTSGNLSIQAQLKAKSLEIVAINDKRSIVWTHIGRVRDPKKGAELDFYACKKCFKAFKITDASRSSTGNLLDYLKRKHGVTATAKRSDESTLGKATPAKVQKIDSFFAPKSITKAHSEKIIGSVLRLCVDRCLPFDVASCDGMANVIHSCLKSDALPVEQREKVFKLLDESTIRKIRLPQKYEALVQKVKEAVASNCCGTGGVTSDMWSDKYHKCEYIAVTLHFLDENFQMHSYCLACRQITDKIIDHVAIARIITAILAD